MPGSSPEGKRQALEMVQSLGEVDTILDVGPGAGTYYWRLAALTHSDWEIQCLMAKP